MTSTEAAAPLERPAAHVMAAVIAVMQHGIEHGLSAPWDVVPGIQAVRIFAPTGTYAVWRNTITLDEEKHEDLAKGLIGVGPCIQWTAKGRLPDSGVRVEIAGYMPATAEVA